MTFEKISSEKFADKQLKENQLKTVNGGASPMIMDAFYWVRNPVSSPEKTGDAPFVNTYPSWTRP